MTESNLCSGSTIPFRGETPTTAGMHLCSIRINAYSFSNAVKRMVFIFNLANTGDIIIPILFMKLFFVFLVLGTLLCANAFSQSIKVGNVQSFSSLGPGSGRNSAEGGSVVIPPGLKSECPNGRILISRDFDRPPNTGAVVYRDLDKPSSAEQNATFDNPGIPGWVGNDHDLILMPNGDVLYVSAATTKDPLNPKPWWFDSTFRDGFGPGARSLIVTWRSKDAGKTFQYVSKYDPATVEGGIPAYPQFRKDSSSNIIPSPKWDMGGTDGPLTVVNPGTEQLYMTNMVVGYNPKYNSVLKMQVPDEKSYVGKTVLLTSTAGDQWKSLGMIPGAYWRLGMVPFTDNNKLSSVIFAPSFDNIVFTGIKDENGKFIFSEASRPAGDPFGWTDDWGKGKKENQILDQRIWANIWSNTVISRCPGDDVTALMVYPSTQNGIHGCSMYFYDQTHDQFQGADPILPQGNSVNDCIFHPTIIDTKTGPLLLYWYDMNSKTLKAKIRGRIITGVNDYSPDFDISTQNNIGYSFDLKTLKPNGKVDNRVDTLNWYGDYHTADGFIDQDTQNSNKDSATAHFFPRWVQPDYTFRYTEITYRYKKPSKIINPRLPNIKVQIWPRPIHPWERPSVKTSLDKLPNAKMRLQIEEIEIGEKKIKTINMERRQ